MTYSWYDLFGNVGVVLVLLTYLLLQTERMVATSMWYSSLNAAGAVLILVSLWFSFNLSAVIIEVAWLLISLYGVGKGLRAQAASD